MNVQHGFVIIRKSYDVGERAHGGLKLVDWFSIHIVNEDFAIEISPTFKMLPGIAIPHTNPSTVVFHAGVLDLWRAQPFRNRREVAHREFFPPCGCRQGVDP